MFLSSGKDGATLVFPNNVVVVVVVVVAVDRKTLRTVGVRGAKALEEEQDSSSSIAAAARALERRPIIIFVTMKLKKWTKDRTRQNPSLRTRKVVKSHVVMSDVHDDVDTLWLSLQESLKNSKRI